LIIRVGIGFGLAFFAEFSTPPGDTGFGTTVFSSDAFVDESFF